MIVPNEYLKKVLNEHMPSLKKNRNKTGFLVGLYVRNYAANIFANLIIIFLNLFTPLDVFRTWQNFLMAGGWIALPFLVVAVFATVYFLQRIIQRPIALVLKQTRTGIKVDRKDLLNAKRRLLNLHHLIALTNLILWCLVGIITLPFIVYATQTNLITSFYLLFRGVIIGLMASFLSFFLIDAYARRRLIPIFFPDGKLTRVQGTIKVSILRRIRLLYGAGTGAPMLILTGTLGLVWLELDDANPLVNEFGTQILIFAIVLYGIFFIIALSLNLLVGRSILNPIKDMMGIVKRVKDGDFSHKVSVVSNDELGMLGDGMNAMTEGLIERDRMRASLNMAKEVQETLLPRTPPQIEGLDIAATITYCDETGGDYYDFLDVDLLEHRRISIIIGDVSGHGVPAALLMTSARALLRQRTTLGGSIKDIVTDVNRQLAADVHESGAFMTLFYLTIDQNEKCLKWVRAGHDPAILYHPDSNDIEELRGSGIVLGVDDSTKFKANVREGLKKGQIIVLGTDGVWEARNANDEQFGKQPILKIIQQQANRTAQEILSACLKTLETFRDGVQPDDDVTLIVIKVTAD